jgi:hypothetical protein
MDKITLQIMRLKQKGYCCSQILLIMALEAQGKTNADLIRAVQGLCFGTAMSGEICGALSGSACLISLYTGKGSEVEETDEQFPLMMSKMTEWFRGVIGGSYGGIRCGDILEKHPDKSACGSIVLETYGKVMEILMAHGVNPNRGRDI